MAFLPRQAPYLGSESHHDRVPRVGYAYPSAPRHRYPRAPGRPNYQKRVLVFQPKAEYTRVRPQIMGQMDKFATASRRESDPFPPVDLGAYKGTLWDPATKIAPHKWLNRPWCRSPLRLAWEVRSYTVRLQPLGRQAREGLPVGPTRTRNSSSL